MSVERQLKASFNFNTFLFFFFVFFFFPLLFTKKKSRPNIMEANPSTLSAKIQEAAISAQKEGIVPKTTYIA